jgi:hypothetical protein
VVYRGQPKNATAGVKAVKVIVRLVGADPFVRPGLIISRARHAVPLHAAISRRRGTACCALNPGQPTSGQKQKKESHPYRMELPLPSGVAELTTKPPGRSSGSRINRRRSAFPPGFFISPRQWLACALTSSVPDYSGGTAPDLHRVPDCLGFGFEFYNRQTAECQGYLAGGESNRSQERVRLIYRQSCWPISYKPPDYFLNINCPGRKSLSYRPITWSRQEKSGYASHPLRTTLPQITLTASPPKGYFYYFN